MTLVPEIPRSEDTRQLRQTVEVAIARVKEQVVLKHQGRNPHVIRRDWSSLSPQLGVDAGIMMRGLLIREQQMDARPSQKARQYGFVLARKSAALKSSSEFSHGDKRQVESARRGELFYRFGHACAKITIPVRVNGNSHFHSSGSTRCISSIALSNSGSCTHVPARSSKSSYRATSSASPAPVFSTSKTVWFNDLRSREARSRMRASRR